MNKLKASLPSDTVMNYLHASFIPQEAWPMFQQAWLTAKALGIAEGTHDMMFAAIWETSEIPLLDPQHQARAPTPADHRRRGAVLFAACQGNGSQVPRDGQVVCDRDADEALRRTGQGLAHSQHAHHWWSTVAT